jgi:hypothetical protein
VCGVAGSGVAEVLEEVEPGVQMTEEMAVGEGRLDVCWMYST